MNRRRGKVLYGCVLCLLMATARAEPLMEVVSLEHSEALLDYIIRHEADPGPDQLRQLAEGYADFALPESVSLYGIAYQSDGLTIRGFLLKPRHEGRLPAIIYNRGGNRDFGSLTDPMASIGLMDLAEIASWGYVVIASQYRGGGGSEGRDQFGGDDVNDVMQLEHVLREMPEVDPARIGMFGWSRGSIMTLLALKRGIKVKAAAIGGVVSDLAAGLEHRPVFDAMFAEMDPDHYLVDKASWLSTRSAIEWVDEIPRTIPILMLSGQSDWRARSTDALRLALALDEAGNPFRFVLFEGGEHSLKDKRTEVFAQLEGWFARFVRDGEIPPVISKTPQD